MLQLVCWTCKDTYIVIGIGVVTLVLLLCGFVALMAPGLRVKLKKEVKKEWPVAHKCRRCYRYYHPALPLTCYGVARSAQVDKCLRFGRVTNPYS